MATLICRISLTDSQTLETADCLSYTSARVPNSTNTLPIFWHIYKWGTRQCVNPLEKKKKKKKKKKQKPKEHGTSPWCSCRAMSVEAGDAAKLWWVVDGCGCIPSQLTLSGIGTTSKGQHRWSTYETAYDEWSCLLFWNVATCMNRNRLGVQ